MAITSTQLTEKLRSYGSAGAILAKKQELFENTRYFVAQKPAVDDFNETIQGYYNGRKVIPGPLANPVVSPVLNVRDVRLLESKYFIRFVDNATTADADPDIKAALFTIMDNHEADEYEKTLADKKGVKLNERKPTGVSGKAT